MSLENYHVPENREIKFDEYGRPYEQTKHGKIMLSMKSKPQYTIKN